MSAVSTHILDTVTGEPAAGVLVRLERVGVGELGRAATNDDGRITDFGVSSLSEGTYRLIFETGPYLRRTGEMPTGQATAGGWVGEVAGRQDGETAGGRDGETAAGRAAGTAFFPEVVVTFHADGQRPKYHVPLLLSPYSYAIYRGS